MNGGHGARDGKEATGKVEGWMGCSSTQKERLAGEIWYRQSSRVVAHGLSAGRGGFFRHLPAYLEGQRVAEVGVLFPSPT